MKKKVLHVTRNFPPLVGGMEKLNYHLFNSLNSFYEASISAPSGSYGFHKAKNYVEFPHKPLWLYLILSLIKTVKLALKVKPDIVFCGSGAAILAGYFSAKLTGAKLVCYLHGLDVVAKNKFYQYVFIPLIKKSNLILVNSHHTQNLIFEAGFEPKAVRILSPGTRMPPDENRETIANEFRIKYKLIGKKILLIAGRITKRKGIEEFIVNVMPDLILKQPDLMLVIIGEEATQAIKHHNGVMKSIFNKVNELGMQKNILILGGVEDEILSAAFFSSQLLVFPILNLPGDVEGFGMIAIEAAAHGLPTIGFAVGGVPDAISDGVSGWLIKSNNYEYMGQVINREISNYRIMYEGCRKFSAQFEWKNFTKMLNKHLQEI